MCQQNQLIDGESLTYTNNESNMTGKKAKNEEVNQ